MNEAVPKLFLTALADLTNWLESAGVPAMIIGGVAASILGRPRATADIDALAIAPTDDRWSQLLDGARRHGIIPRVAAPLEVAREVRVLLLRHAPSSLHIDVTLAGMVPFESEAVARAQTHNVGGINMRLPQVEDLLVMKAIAHRPQDLRDIEGLLDAFPRANVDGVRRFVREFAAAADQPDMPEEFEKLLAQRRADAGAALAPPSSGPATGARQPRRGKRPARKGRRGPRS